ncbi:Annexin_9 [Hexamita inflata]|uniref:Annexin_9 n=1 Tax=Hexamita inflata TaxID=28002 RepID=A0ABP1K165_9EUKA
MRGQVYPNIQIPQVKFDEFEEAKILRKAMKGLGTDEKSIFNIASSHNAEERFLISRAYASSTGYPIQTSFGADFAGNAGILMQQLFDNRYYQWLDYVDNLVEEKRVITAVILMSDHDLPFVNQTLKNLARRDFYNEYKGHFPISDWGRLLCGWVSSYSRRDWDPVVAADELYAAAKGAGTNEDLFIKYLSNTTHECFAKINILRHCVKQLKKNFLLNHNTLTCSLMIT